MKRPLTDQELTAVIDYHTAVAATLCIFGPPVRHCTTSFYPIPTVTHYIIIEKIKCPNRSNMSDVTAGALVSPTFFRRAHPLSLRASLTLLPSLSLSRSLGMNYRMFAVIAYFSPPLSTHPDVSSLTRMGCPTKPYEPTDVNCFNNFHTNTRTWPTKNGRSFDPFEPTIRPFRLSTYNSGEIDSHRLQNVKLGKSNHPKAVIAYLIYTP